MTEGRFVSYLRVSTQRQGQSGLGEEAQRRSVNEWLNGGDQELLFEFVEQETGTGKRDRPVLHSVLYVARRLKRKLIFAKLDRLARNVQFASTLLNSGIDIVFCDLPDANRLTLHVMAAIAEHEATLISVRTKEALKAAKARGTLLGAARPGSREIALGALARGVTHNQSKTAKHAESVRPVIDGIRASGLTALKAIAEAMNALAIPTARGGLWYPTTVRDTLNRAA